MNSWTPSDLKAVIRVPGKWGWEWYGLHGWMLSNVFWVVKVQEDTVWSQQPLHHLDCSQVTNKQCCDTLASSWWRRSQIQICSHNERRDAKGKTKSSLSEWAWVLASYSTAAQMRNNDSHCRGWQLGSSAMWLWWMRLRKWSLVG